MIDELNQVCAQTHPTAAQRRAALIADATVLAHRTFGREAIAALQGQWHADEEQAELRFTYEGHTPAGWLLMQQQPGRGRLVRLIGTRRD